MRRNPVQGILDSTLKRRVPQTSLGFLTAFYAFDMDLSQGDAGCRIYCGLRHSLRALFCCTW
jgi:hypothetical protein